mmetsp:Transcript_10638/g.21047  ORF Transcript_10638/g.21047 Transcript_10638/m.21047 type:complete len:285 (-) Transcript_10638:718-1572(-)
MKDGIWAREGLKVVLLPPSCSGGRRPRESHGNRFIRHWCHADLKRNRNVFLHARRVEGWSDAPCEDSAGGVDYGVQTSGVQRRAFIAMSLSLGMVVSKNVHADDGVRRLTREQRLALQNVAGAPKQRGGTQEPVIKRVPAASGRMQAALQLLQSASDDQAMGEYQSALEKYKSLVLEYPEFEGLGERGRVGQALMEYQVGMVDVAILHLEDEEVALRGLAEVHAALASVLYVERPERLAFAELQWDIASEFDSRYSSVVWVKKEKKWPPRMLEALESFLTLKSG